MYCIGNRSWMLTAWNTRVSATRVTLSLDRVHAGVVRLLRQHLAGGAYSTVSNYSSQWDARPYNITLVTSNVTTETRLGATFFAAFCKECGFSLPPCLFASSHSLTTHFSFHPAPLNPRFSPFAANPLPRLAPSCYPCPMSAPAQSPSYPSVRIASPPQPSQFPKWNCRDQHRRFPSHSLALSYEGSLACPDKGRATCLPRAQPRGHCLSNRNTPELESLVTRTKQSPGQFLIATFRAFAHRSAGNFQSAHRPSPTPALIATKRVPRKLEISLTHIYSATSLFLIDNFCRFVGGFSSRLPMISRLTRRSRSVATAGRRFSNRKIYEKLELLVTYRKQTLAPFLIVKKMQAVQGALFAFRGQRGICPAKRSEED